MTNHREMPPELEAKREAKRFFSGIGLSVLLFILVTELATALIVYITQQTFPKVISTWWYSRGLNVVSIYGIGLPVLMLALRRVPVAPVSGLEASAPRRKFGWFFLAVAVAFGYMYIGANIGQIALNILSAITGHDYVYLLESIVDKTPLWATVLFAVILVPIGEELVFRKLLIDRMRRYGDTAAIFLSALFFGLFHGNLHQLFYAFLVGLVLGYVYTRTGKLRFSVALHMVINLLCGVVIPRLTSLLPVKEFTALPTTELPAFIMEHPLEVLGILLISAATNALMTAAAVLTVVLCACRRLGLRKSQIPMSRDALFSAALGSVGVAALIAFNVILIVLNMIRLSA